MGRRERSSGSSIRQGKGSVRDNSASTLLQLPFHVHVGLGTPRKRISKPLCRRYLGKECWWDGAVQEASQFVEDYLTKITSGAQLGNKSGLISI